MKSIHTEKAPAAIGPYSQAIEANGTVYVSGQLPVDPHTGQMIEGDIKTLAHQVFKNISQILSAAGVGLDNVVKVTVMMADMNDFADMNEAYAPYLSEPYPARPAYAVKTLPKNSRLEIECIAVAPQA